MVILSENTVVSLSLIIKTESASERVYVEIKNGFIHLRARSMQTEVSLKQAQFSPSNIANAAKALMPDAYTSELDQLVGAMIKYLG